MANDGSWRKATPEENAEVENMDEWASSLKAVRQQLEQLGELLEILEEIKEFKATLA